jgi:serine/threonine protein kinase
MGRLVVQALEQAGIRPSQRFRKVSDYVLQHLLAEGPGYQDWYATHASVNESIRRVRLYLVRTGATPDERATNQRAALREFQLLETLQHPGVLRAYGLTEHELGPALLFEHDPLAIRLDHFLAQQGDRISITLQIELIRQIAEVVRYAHDKRIIHRALSPQSILVVNANSPHPRVKVCNWQAGYRRETSPLGTSRGISATCHVDRVVEDAATGYMAPEAFSDHTPGEYVDVFSLGAIAWHILAHNPPAANRLELDEKLRQQNGLQISAVLNGAGVAMQDLVLLSTRPLVCDRTESVALFLAQLDDVEAELTEPELDVVEVPELAKQGDQLPGGFEVVRRLGQGACAVVLLVRRQERELVLKIANDPQHNHRIRDEADILEKVRHSYVVELVDRHEIGDRFAFSMNPVFAERGRHHIETLRQRLAKDGPLHIELLERFGEDLLGVVAYLEEQGLSHRDIKPDNIAVGMVGRGDLLHLVLFDFSLGRTPPENIRAGTIGYLDPFLPLRDPPRWDLYAERYAAAITLFELATATTPTWGDRTSDPSYLPPDTEITIDAEKFDPGLREPLTAFFRKAFRRDITQRFDNADQMLDAWRRCFNGLAVAETADPDERPLETLLAEATWETSIADLGLGTRATNALDRANVLRVSDLLVMPSHRLSRMRGVGNKTRRELGAAVRLLRERLGTPTGVAVSPDPVSDPAPTETAEEADDPQAVQSLSVDLLAERVHRVGSRDRGGVSPALHLLLGLDPQHPLDWPSQVDVAKVLGVTRARVGQIVTKLHERWGRDPALTAVRNDLVEFVAGQGGMASLREAVEGLLAARGSMRDEPARSQLARAVVRAAIEVERTRDEPRLIVRREGTRVVLAQSAELGLYTLRLGDAADAVAAEDPLLSPARALERLRAVRPPAQTVLGDARLVRLAAEVSATAVVSGLRELYPRGMSATRALKLSLGTLQALGVLTVSQLAERVASRYPEAAPLPGRPELDDLLQSVGLDYTWKAAEAQGVGAYVSPLRDRLSMTTGSGLFSRGMTGGLRADGVELTPELADVRQFEERLQRGLAEGSFLALLVDPRKYERARVELCQRFPVEPIDFEEIFLEALRAACDQARVQWEVVLRTDATPQRGDWDRLLLLIERAMPAVEARLKGARQTILLVYPGLLARYGQMDLLSRLSLLVGRPDGIPGLWLLVPGSTQALLDGQPVPLLGPGQRAQIPERWLDSGVGAGQARGETR